MNFFWRKEKGHLEQSQDTIARYRGFVDAEDGAAIAYKRRVCPGSDEPAWSNVMIDLLYPGRVELQIWHDHDIWKNHGYEPLLNGNVSRSLLIDEARSVARALLQAADEAEQWKLNINKRAS